MPSLDGLLYLKPKREFIIVIVISFLIISIPIIMYFKNSYDIYNIKGYIKCNPECIVNINILDISTINNGAYLKINKNKNAYQIKTIGKMEFDYLTMTNYQTVEIQTKLNDELKKDNLVVELSFYTNKERLLKKIIKRFI